MLLSDARAALEDEQTPIDRLRSLTGELHQMAQGLRTSVGSQSGAAAAGASGGTRGDTGAGDDADDVIDAEFTAH